jgi:hypothetical protein
VDKREEFWSDTPEAEEYRQGLKEIAEQVERDVCKKAQADARKIMRSSPEALISAAPDQFWSWWTGTKSEDLHKKEIIPPCGGPAKKGGGSKGKRKKKRKKKEPEYLKKWGT